MLDELGFNMKHLKNEKSLDPIGFHVEFYKQMWPVGPPYLKMCQEAIKGGGIGELVNVGIIKLILKMLNRFGGWLVAYYLVKCFL